MNILFCNNPFETKPVVDLDYEDEFASAKENGFTAHLFSFEMLTREGDAELATARIKRSDTLQSIIYRGWMLKPYQYALLYEVLMKKNYKLVNSPAEYQNCHYLPDSYAFTCEHTPKTIWLKADKQSVDYDQLFGEITVFKGSPIIVKDYVKSQKHYWDTACFIPAASDNAAVKAVVGKFVELQDDDLNEGLVIREFVELEDLATHSRSGMPLKQEYRMFFLNGHLIGYYDYWEEGVYTALVPPPVELFEKIAKGVRSNFFSMDIALAKNGRWMVIELGDGQVAGLPDSVGRVQFYDQVRRFMVSVNRTPHE